MKLIYKKYKSNQDANIFIIIPISLDINLNFYLKKLNNISNLFVIGVNNNDKESFLDYLKIKNQKKIDIIGIDFACFYILNLIKLGLINVKNLYLLEFLELNSNNDNINNLIEINRILKNNRLSIENIINQEINFYMINKDKNKTFRELINANTIANKNSLILVIVDIIYRQSYDNYIYKLKILEWCLTFLSDIK